MPSETIQNYLNDTTIDFSRRKYAIDQLKLGTTEAEIEDGIKIKYGDMYTPKVAEIEDVEPEAPVAPAVEPEVFPPQFRAETISEAGERLLEVAKKAPEKVRERITGGVERIKRGIEEFAVGPPTVSPLVKPEAALAVLGGVGEIAATPFSVALTAVEPELEAVAEAVPEEAKARVVESIEALPEDVRETGEDAIASLGLLLIEPQLKFAQKLLKRVPKTVLKPTPDKKIALIEDKISPKLTSKETAKIISEGRAIRGKESAVFGKRPDIVTQAENIQKSAQTINKLIPNADKLDDLALNAQLRDKIDDIANNLRPQMKGVSLKPETVKKAETAWTRLKKAQQGDPAFAAVPGAGRMQKNFQNFIDSLKKGKRGAKGVFRPKNLEDAWNARIAYDKTIKEGVKKATPQSSESLQAQHDMWLQNRQILNDIITSDKTGLAKAATAFDDMSNLYNASQNIISKAKIDILGAPGAFSKENVIKQLKRIGIGAIGAKILLD